MIPDSPDTDFGPVRLCTMRGDDPGADWLRVALAQLAEDAARFYFNSGETMLLELHTSHADHLRDCAWGAPHFAIGFVESPRELTIMLPVGRATILFTWPDENSISLLEPARAGRRLVLRRARQRVHDGGKTE
jgi:hypothetical protein